MNSKWINEKDKLNDLINVKNVSYEQIGKMYNCSGNNIKKVARRIGISLPIRRKIHEDRNTKKKTHICINCNKEFDHIEGNTNKYCCKECEKSYKHLQKYKKIINGDPSIMRPNYIPKAFKNDIIKEQGNVCAICGISQIWNNQKLVFILDHIDGHASNNKRSNLRCICPNCDSQLSTYKSKNKNGERYYYRYPKKQG